MQLTCPTCQSGLQVPDGTTAHVRCPACKSVFPAEDGLAPAVPLPPPPAPPPPPAKPKRAEPKPKTRDEEESEKKNRDFDPDEPPDPNKPRPRPKDKSKLSQEQKRELRAGFARGYFGARCVQISLLLYLPAVLLVPLHQILAEITKSEMDFILMIAGILGLANWAVGTVGLALCVSGPPSAGHWRFGISALIAGFIHGILLLAVVLKSQEAADYRNLDRETMRWAQIATQYESLSFYLSYVVYPDDIPLKRTDTIIGFLAGVMEMVRLILILMTLSCLAKAAGDKPLADDCTRMAGRITLIPAFMAFGMLMYKIVVIETGATGGFMVYFLNYIYRGITLAVAAILGMTIRTVGEVADACDSPFQSDLDAAR